MKLVKLILVFILTAFVTFNVQAQLTTGTVDFNVDNLYSMQSATVSLSDDTELVLVLDYIVDHTPDSYTWVGSVQSDVTSRVFITVNKPNAVGVIQTTYNLYELTITETPSDPVKQIDPSALPSEADPLQEPIFKSGFEGEPFDTLANVQAVCDDTPANIDVLVLFSDDAKNASGDIEAKIREAVVMANDSFQKSQISPEEPDGISLKLNLVHMQMVDVTEGASGNYSNVLRGFQERGDGFLDEVHSLRDQFNADLNILIYESGTVCGRAYSAVVGPEENGFAVVKLECLNDHTFTHEIGHLFGAMHDRYALDSPPYSGSNYGYVHTGLILGWRTIMAYTDECDDAFLSVWCPRPGFFSSPDYNHNGDATGVSDTDNRQQLIGAASAIACYRDAQPTNQPQTRPLNDTGITWGANFPSGNNEGCIGETIAAQDCSHGRDVSHDDDSDGHAGFSFTKLDANGNDLPASASEWSCVHDEVTGLTWEVKTDDGGMRDTDNSYTWYNPNPNTNGGNSGTQNGGSCMGSTCDTYSYVQAVNAATTALCGARDWRMPWREELRSIADFSRVNPAIDTRFFPNQRFEHTWSASPAANDSDNAWSIHFPTGRDSMYFRNFGYQVRLVRGVQ